MNSDNDNAASCYPFHFHLSALNLSRLLARLMHLTGPCIEGGLEGMYSSPS